MELIYEGKKDTQEILDQAYTYKNVPFDKENDIIFKGDNFNALSILLVNGYKGKIDLIYIDPPFSTNNNFLISEKRTSTISRPNDGIVAYDDKLLGKDYLEFLRERLILMKELLSEEGSIYVHNDYKIGHYVKVIMDEIFGEENFVNDITRIKGNPKNFSRKAFGNQKDLILFYAKKKGKHIYNQITEQLSDKELEHKFIRVDESGRRYNTVPVHAPGESNGPTGMEWKGILPPEGRHWRTAPSKMDELDEKNLIEWSKNGVPRMKKFSDEHKGKKIQDVWLNFKDPQYPDYPTQKNIDMLDLIIKQSSNENSIVLDCFAGSGNTLKAAQYNNRQFIGVDKSELSIKVIKKRINNIVEIIIE